MLTAAPWDQFPIWRHSRRRLCVLRFEVSRSVITVQREFRAWFKKYIILVWCIFFKTCMELTLHCYHRYGHLKTEHTESPAVTPSWKPVQRPRGKHEKQTAGSAWVTLTVSTADSVCCACVGWEINV
jgi:hypothetical protein